MGKRQGSQPKKSSKTPNRHVTAATKTVPFVLNLFIVFTRRHPFLCLTGVWLAMLMLGWFSIRGIIYTDSSPMEAEKTQAEVLSAQPPQPQFAQPNQTASSVGMLVILALCCAGTTLLLARQLRPVKPVPHRRVVQRAAKPQRPASPSEPRKAIAQPGQVAAPQPLSRAAQPVSYQVNRSAQPRVSVIPPEQDAPLDWGDAGLANMMDIRRRGSISSSL